MMEQVIFACVHNAGRSQMAAAFFNELADPAKARAQSAGTEPGYRVHPAVMETMREVGVDLAGAVPTLLTARVLANASHLITMGCGESCPVAPKWVRRDDWPLDDPKGQPVERVRQIRDEVRSRVSSLVQQHGWGRAGVDTATPSASR
jgi:arsenate reductase